MRPGYFLRCLLAMPFVVLAILLFTASALMMIFVDGITGKPLSKELLG